MKRALLLVLLFARRDLDVGIPPGTPLEWNREFRQPVPTGGRGNVPTLDKKPAPNTTTSERPRANDDYIVASLYDYFRVTTVDIMAHISVSLPNTKGKVSQDDVATGGGFVMAWNYPPEMPTELYWMAAMACLRQQLHPEIISWPESAAYCLELGEPAWHASTVSSGDLSTYLRKHLSDLPKAPPTVPKMKGAADQVIVRIAAVELSGGFPHGLDPSFSRRTLALGDDAFWPVVECARSPHTFLARNAVVVLSHYARPEAAEELIKLFRTTQDPVIKVRALNGLVRRGGAKPLVPDLVKIAGDAKDEPMRALAIYSLGLIGDSAGLPPLKELAKRLDDELFFTLTPALARLCDKETLLLIERAVGAKINGVDTVNPAAPNGKDKWRIIHQMAVIGLAMAGEQKFVDETLKRTLDGFHPVVHFLAVEALASMGDKGAETLRKKVIDPLATEEIVRLEALRRLAAMRKIGGPALKELALSTKGASTRGLALQQLATIEETITKEVCAQIIGDYAAGKGGTKPEDDFVVAVAAQIGGRLGALKAPELIKAVERAIVAKAFARREGKNETDITKAEIKLHPALLEILLIELGRTGSATAAPVLIAMLTKPPFPQGRAEAAIALGNVGTKEGIDVLLKVIEDDPDGWVRMCGYRALKALTKQDHFCDWVFGDKEHRRKCVEAYKGAAKR